MPDEFEFSSEEISAGRRLFEQPWHFIKGVVDLSQLPAADSIEIAFAGRSNVGKSSLINALVRQNGLARTSNTPGRTQELNIFEPESLELRVIDMPGYGYAKAPKDKVDTWTDLVKDYLSGRPNLARVFLLIDSRHGIKPNDDEIMTMLDATAVSYQIVLTKGDKLSVSKLHHIADDTEKKIRQHAAAFPLLLTTAAEKGQGISEVRSAIARLVAERSPTSWVQ